MSGPTQVLIVEDTSASVIQLTHAVARSFPEANLALAMNIAAAHSQLARLSAIDLAIVDLGLPDGDGHEVLTALRARFPSALVLVYTIFDDDGSLFRALACGIDGYLLKHETSEGLLKGLQRIVAGEPPISPRIALRILREFRSVQNAAAGTGMPLRPSMLYRSDSTAPTSKYLADVGSHIRPYARPALAQPSTNLTRRELETLTLAAEGQRLPDIALRLGVTRTTAATYLKRIYKKLSVRNRAQATLEAARLGLVDIHGKYGE